MRSPLPSLLPAMLMWAGAAWAACPTNVHWVEFEGFCYWRSTYTAPGTEAVTACRTMGAGSQVASIHSLVENSFVMQTYNYGETWIGLNDHSNEGSFVWADGTTVNFTYWYAGEPNDLEHDQDCVMMPHWEDPTSGKWDDNMCYYDYNFLCKMPAY